MGFLSEAMSSLNQVVPCPFTESIILATLFGRALAHKQQASVERVYCDISRLFWDRHEWLDTIWRTRANILAYNYPPSSERSDCMLLFTNMLAQTTLLFLCNVLESLSWDTEEYRTALAEYRQRSLQAARELVNLTRSMSHLSYFKVSLLPSFYSERYSDSVI